MAGARRIFVAETKRASKSYGKKVAMREERVNKGCHPLSLFRQGKNATYQEDLD